MSDQPIALKNFGLALILLFAFIAPASSQHLQKAWDAIVQNDRIAAQKHLQKALDNPKEATDALSTLYYLEGYESQWNTFDRAFATQKSKIANPYPYYFLFWDKASIAGDYGLKTPEQVKFLKTLADEPTASNSLRMTAKSFLYGHFLAEGDLKKGLEIAAELSAVREWQVVGPFDNVLESGFDKSYPPITQAKPDAVFTSSYNADIRWQKCNAVSNIPWVLIDNMVPWSNSIVYAQSFVTSPKDEEVVLALGVTGNYKVWVNDRLVLSDPEMRNSESPVFTAPCKLKKGANRILVQIGFLEQDGHGFTLQICDRAGKPLPDLQSSVTFAPYPDDSKSPMPASIPNFTITFFKEKLAADPDNLVNYLLLARAYGNLPDLTAGLALVNKAIEKAPNCAMLRFYRMAYYQELENLTGADEESKTILALDPESSYALLAKYSQEMESENLEEAENIAARFQVLFGDGFVAKAQKLQILNAHEQYQESIALIEEMYEQLPGVWEMAQAKYQIESLVKKDQKSAFKVYESFLKKDFQLGAALTLANEYLTNGKPEEAVKLYEKVHKFYPMNLATMTQLFDFYFSKKEYEEAQVWLDKLLAIAPNSHTYLSSAAKLAEQKGDEKRALELYKTALKHGPNDFDLREHIRELEKKPSLKKNFPETDPYALLKSASDEGKKGKCPWFTVLFEKQIVLYPEQNSECTVTQIIKVLDEDGVNTWKETTIGSSGNERLIIEKAEVVKPSGKKVAAERNYNQLVFGNLEPGDGIVLKYRLQSYSYNRISREFDASFGFDWFTPTEQARLCILAPKNVQLQSVAGNGAPEATRKDIPAEGYTLHTWEAKNLKALDSEPLMPYRDDVRAMVMVGTMKDWSLISEWYGDISARQARSDHEVKKLAAELCPKGENLSETAKARRIYEWILKNIRYSSVAFRQSGWVPQRASKVIQTRLGDCKDMATLYAALARDLGLSANLVLVSSRTNGTFSLALPNMDFNHCIVKVVADGTVWYLELTDASLPFGSLPNEDFQSMALDIPFGKADGAVSKLFVLDPANRTPNGCGTQVEITVGQKDLTLAVKSVSSGALTGWMRDGFKNLPAEKRLVEFQENIAKDFANPVSVKTVAFGSLEMLNDTLQHTVSFVVKNEVVEVGDLQTFKIPYYNTFVKAGSFPEDEDRKHNFAYRDYETADAYHDVITVRLPEGKKFANVPPDTGLTFGKTHYRLSFVKKSANVLVVTRDIQVQRADIAAAEYDKFREFVLAIAQAEGKILSFK